MFFSVGTETQNYPGAQEYYGFYTDNRGLPPPGSGSRSVLYPRICKCCISRGWFRIHSRKGRMNFRVQLTPSRHGLVWTLFWGHVREYTQSLVICFNYTLSASRQPFADEQQNFIKRDFSLLRPAGNLERQKCIFSRSLIKHGSRSGRRSRVRSASRTCGSSGCCLSDCGAGRNPCPWGKRDQQKPKGNWTPAFNELTLLKPEVKPRNR